MFEVFLSSFISFLSLSMAIRGSFDLRDELETINSELKSNEPLIAIDKLKNEIKELKNELKKLQTIKSSKFIT